MIYMVKMLINLINGAVQNFNVWVVLRAWQENIWHFIFLTPASLASGHCWKTWDLNMWQNIINYWTNFPSWPRKIFDMERQSHKLVCSIKIRQAIDRYVGLCKCGPSLFLASLSKIKCLVYWNRQTGWKGIKRMKSTI